MSDDEFDVIVLGAGPAGEVAAGRAAEHGLAVALVEDRLVGGECSFWACMPSKALLRPAQAVAEARRIPGAAQAVTGPLDVDAVLARRDDIIHGLDDSAQLPWVEDHGITLVRGHGRLAGERLVAVGERTLRARRAIVVATGTAPSLPPIDGLDRAGAWTNREATTASVIPERLIVLGGGVVGVEMAGAFASLGSTVTLVETLPRLLSGEEEDASTVIADSLREAGVTIHLGVEATSVRRETAGGEVVLTVEGIGEIAGDELLVAAGRHALTDDLGLDTVGIEPGGTLDVDDDLRVGGRGWLYAVGDVNGRALLTHMGKEQGRFVADRLVGRDVPVLDLETRPPRVVFSEPQVAAVGHTVASAKEAGLQVTVVDHPQDGVAGGSFVGRGAPGFVRLVIDDDRRVVVGATFVGPEVAEQLHAATIAVTAEVPLERLWHAVPAFPTRSEVWLRLLEHYGM